MTNKTLNTEEKGIQYIKSQINLLMRDEWLIHEKPVFLSVAINRHIASLITPSDLDAKFTGIPYSKKYFPVYSTSGAFLEYQKISTSSIPQFEKFIPHSAMPSFAEQPLACFIFTGALDDEFTFLDPASGTQISAFKAFDIYIRNASINSGAVNLDGRKLEILCAISAILSSRRCNGNFIEFLQRFVFNLSYETTQWTLDDAALTDESRAYLENLVVPLLIPMGSEWDEDLTMFLHDFYKQNSLLPQDQPKKICNGVCELFRQQIQYDFKITDGTGKSVIAMEFKLHEAPLSGSLLRTIFGKLEAHSHCRVGIVVGLHFAAALAKKENWAELPSYYSLYSVSRSNDQGGKLKIKKHFSPDEEMSVEEALPQMRDLHLEPKKQPFIVILVSLLELNDLKGNVSEFLEKVPIFRG